jgi:hypothetical protein
VDPIGFLMAAAGLFCALGGVFDWEWFMNNRKALFMTSILSRTGARIFYVLLGLAIMVLGTLVAMGIIQKH